MLLLCPYTLSSNPNMQKSFQISQLMSLFVVYILLFLFGALISNSLNSERFNLCNISLFHEDGQDRAEEQRTQPLPLPSENTMASVTKLFQFPNPFMDHNFHKISHMLHCLVDLDLTLLNHNSPIQRDRNQFFSLYS